LRKEKQIRFHPRNPRLNHSAVAAAIKFDQKHEHEHDYDEKE
jgi:hypothetical protein